MFEGFTVGKAADAIVLAESAGIDTSTLDEDINFAAALSLGQLLGLTYEALNGFKVSVGLLDEPLVGNVRPGAHFISSSTVAGLGIGPFHFEIPAPPGVMLYRVVPEPSTLALLCCAWRSVAIFKRVARVVRNLGESEKRLLRDDAAGVASCSRTG
jgi:hypothetical protein